MKWFVWGRSRKLGCTGVGRCGPSHPTKLLCSSLPACWAVSKRSQKSSFSCETPWFLNTDNCIRSLKHTLKAHGTGLENIQRLPGLLPAPQVGTIQPRELSCTNQNSTNQTCGTGGLLHVMKQTRISQWSDSFHRGVSDVTWIRPNLCKLNRAFLLTCHCRVASFCFWSDLWLALGNFNFMIPGLSASLKGKVGKGSPGSTSALWSRVGETS